MTDKFRENDKYRGNSIDGFFLDEEGLEPGTKHELHRHVTTPILDYPEHSNRHRFGRIVREPSDRAPNWVDRLIDTLIAHQVTVIMVLWLAIAGLLAWWLF